MKMAFGLLQIVVPCWSDRMKRGLSLLFSLLLVTSALAERINHEGRLLGPLPVVTNAILFNTTNADAVVAAMQILPVTNPWNEDISHRPVLPNSDAMIAQIMADLASNRRTLRAFKEMNYVLVPDAQPTAPIEFLDYPDESDLDGGNFPFGLWPIPANMPIETWPAETGGLSLEEWQQDVNNTGGDRHSIIVKPGAGFIWETWQAKLVGANWQASNGAKFNLNTNALRPAGWTSGDAAGLPMFPALVRFDECERGMVEHAMRIVVGRSRREYIYPATHFASTTPATQTNVPAMGQRVRLKSSFVIPDHWTTQEKAVLRGLKKYGAVVADNGNFFSISVTPDDRWSVGCFNRLSSISITNFEVIQTTGPNAGPRSPGAPTAHAGSNQTAFVGIPVNLEGFVNYTSAPTLFVRWQAYPESTNVVFAEATLTNTTVTFNAPGSYLLRLSASNGIHAVAYDVVQIEVTTPILLSITNIDAEVHLSWTGGTAPFVVERTTAFAPPNWGGILTTAQPHATVPMTSGSAFFRIREE
jgi:hypothetical protein